jgi:hypothetical protein
MSETNWTYFQYQKDANLPVFIRVNTSDFDPSLLNLLVTMRFVELSEAESEELEGRLTPEFSGNVLTMRLASPSVTLQINQVAESERYGAECITPKEGYKVYRYKGKALLVYSFGIGHWEMGCHRDFGNEAESSDYRTIISRYLSWALVGEGIVGFWGVPVEEGIVVLRKKEAEGEAIFVDVKRVKLYSIDGAKPMRTMFKILRLDSALKNKNVRMTNEELLSFLTVNSTFFDYQGLTVPVRQAIKSLARIAEGLVHPKESFKPRTDLSL